MNLSKPDTIDSSLKPNFSSQSKYDLFIRIGVPILLAALVLGIFVCAVCAAFVLPETQIWKRCLGRFKKKNYADMVESDRLQKRRDSLRFRLKSYKQSAKRYSKEMNKRNLNGTPDASGPSTPFTPVNVMSAEITPSSRQTTTHLEFPILSTPSHPTSQHSKLPALSHKEHYQHENELCYNMPSKNSPITVDYAEPINIHKPLADSDTEWNAHSFVTKVELHRPTSSDSFEASKHRISSDNRFNIGNYANGTQADLSSQTKQCNDYNYSVADNVKLNHHKNSMEKSANGNVNIIEFDNPAFSNALEV